MVRDTIIDAAMVGVVYNKGKYNEFFNSYGMVIMDDYVMIGLSQGYYKNLNKVLTYK